MSISQPKMHYLYAPMLPNGSIAAAALRSNQSYIHIGMYKIRRARKQSAQSKPNWWIFKLQRWPSSVYITVYVQLRRPFCPGMFAFFFYYYYFHFIMKICATFRKWKKKLQKWSAPCFTHTAQKKCEHRIFFIFVDFVDIRTAHKCIYIH